MWNKVGHIVKMFVSHFWLKLKVKNAKYHLLNISIFWVKKFIKMLFNLLAFFHRKKEVKNSKHFSPLFELKSKWKMWNKVCDVAKMFLLHFLTELKVKMKVKKSKVFSLTFSPEIKVKNVKQSWSYCWDVCFTFFDWNSRWKMRNITGWTFQIFEWKNW